MWSPQGHERVPGQGDCVPSPSSHCDVCSVTDFLAQKKLPQPCFRHPSSVTNQDSQPSRSIDIDQRPGNALLGPLLW